MSAPSLRDKLTAAHTLLTRALTWVQSAESSRGLARQEPKSLGMDPNATAAALGQAALAHEEQAHKLGLQALAVLLELYGHPKSPASTLITSLIDGEYAAEEIGGSVTNSPQSPEKPG